ncbi:hypothetical protein GPECTOR_7g1087 [Gonium pectorale]|uniref:WSC domain-containing protein n=1 Tax=Gonium pectorale TaxID=33097 RepID=A0A150GTT2_GONPE|nr:hypothetical protein GPECTOR_7g1087 [Gonium pectorale]|eukprot:KXZ53194.1 hypothetical protein GPECTOR_7g1087 [Gonium pectorale]
MAVFGGERMLSDCCEDVSAPSQLDLLVASTVKWAAAAALATAPAGTRARIRVADRKFVAKLHGDVFLEPGGAGAGRKPYLPYLSLGGFQEGGRKAAVDVYVIMAYDSLYGLDGLKRGIFSHVAGGRALVVAGPDVMPAAYYEVASGGSSGALADGRRRLSAAAAAADWRGFGTRRLLANSTGASGNTTTVNGNITTSLTTNSTTTTTTATNTTATNGTSTATTSGGFNGTAVDVSEVTGPMGILFGNSVTDAGSNTTVTNSEAASVNSTVLLSNALIAAQQLVDRIRGDKTLTATQLAAAESTFFTARATLSRNSPGSQSFWTLVDTYDSLTASPPPSPPPPSPSPPPRPPPSPTRAPPSPSAVSALCISNATSVNATRLAVLRPPVNRTACAAQVSAAVANGALAGPASSLFVALRGVLCFALAGPLPDSVRLSASACGVACSGNSGETCGNSTAGSFTAYTFASLVSSKRL